MRLTKWYADCLTPDGALLICYLARLSWGRLRLHYAALLEQDAPGATLRQRQVLRPGTVRSSVGGAGSGEDPGAGGETTAGGTVELDVPALAFGGSWRGGSPTRQHQVVGTDAGSITWQGLTLGAHVQARVGRREVAGTGYAEVVRLTLPPWRLPFDDLGWGRFVADDAQTGLTWTRIGEDAWVYVQKGAGSRGPLWAADSPGRLVVIEAVGDKAVPGRDDISGGGIRVSWDGGEPIRGEDVATTVLGPLAGLVRPMLPRGIRHIDERKCLARGSLTAAGCQIPGWIIHERVRWR